MIGDLFQKPFGQGYPKTEAARKLKDTCLLKENRHHSQVDIIDLLKGREPDLKNHNDAGQNDPFL